MKTCENCIWRRYTCGYGKKIFKCKMEEGKRFNYPKLHGWFCKRYANKRIEKV